MTKRIISLLLLLVFLCSVPEISASAVSKVDVPIADIVIYADKSVKIGSEFEVGIYIENITEKNGVIGDDLPLTYDRDRLSVVGLEPVFPEGWNGCGTFLGIDPSDYDPKNPAHYPYYLRSLPDAKNDMFTNPAYRITESKAIGYKVKFKALRDGEAFVAVESDFDNNRPIMLVVIENDEVMNYGARGMTVTVNVTDESTSQTAPDISDESSKGGEPSMDVTVSDDSSEETSEILRSEDVSAEDEPSESISSAERSAAEISELSADSSKAEESADTQSKKGSGALGWIIAALAVVAAAVAVTGAVLWRKSKKA